MNTKIKALMACGLIAASVLVPLTVVGAAEQPGFVGSWESTDVNDGSYQTMQIRGGGGHYAVIIQDSLCSGCCPECGEEAPPCKGIGVGTINEVGDTLTVELTVYAMGGSSYVCHGATPTVNFTYINDNILKDDAGDGSTWTRVK